MQQEEAQLKEQLFLYMDKFEEFQATMAKTNELFTAFKQETAKLTKQILKLEKEMVILCTKWENNNKTLLQMAEEKTIRDENYKVFQIKLEWLEKLYKALQIERNELSEKVVVLKGLVSVKVADVDLAVPVMHSCADLDSSNMLYTSCKRAPGFHLEAEGMNEAKCYQKALSTGPPLGID
uniref:CYorf15B n=1 Tax=Pongo pygmaeus TaxID=9600 RepID=W8BYV4_PONPY